MMVEFNRARSHADNGEWIKMRSILGHWVLLVVEGISERQNRFEAGKTETVATCKFADLTAGDTALRLVSFSNPYIVDKLVVGTATVGQVAEAESSRPGFARALILISPEGEALTAMEAAATAILEPSGVQVGMFD